VSIFLYNNSNGEIVIVYRELRSFLDDLRAEGELAHVEV
jgi:hypothetical protein